MIAHILHHEFRPNIPKAEKIAINEHNEHMKCLGRIATSTAIGQAAPATNKPYDCMKDPGFTTFRIPKDQLDLHKYL